MNTTKLKLQRYRAGYWVPILGSSIRVLETISSAKSELTLHRISTLAQVGKKPAFRILYTLQKFMAALLKVQEMGYSLDEEETELGAYRIAVPILNSGGVAIGAISASGPSSRILKQQKQIILALKKALAAISKSLDLNKPSGNLERGQG